MLHDTVDDKVQVFLEASKVPQFEDFIRGNVNLEAVVSIEGILKYRPKKDQRVHFLVFHQFTLLLSCFLD